MFTGSWEWLIILAVLLLLFGGSKLPKLGGALGESIKNFKKGLKEQEKARLSSDSSPLPAGDPKDPKKSSKKSQTSSG